MRRILLFVSCAALLAGGGYLLWRLPLCVSGGAHGLCQDIAAEPWTPAGLLLLGGLLLWNEVVRPWTKRRSATQVAADARLLSEMLPRQSPRSGRKRQRARNTSPLSALERHLHTAILDPSAREGLIEAAMRKTGGDRTAAMRKVLGDLEGEIKRWS